MSPQFSSSSVSFKSENITDNLPRDPNIASSKIILSIATVFAISTATVAAPALTIAPVIKGINETKNQNVSNSSQADLIGMYFSNKENRDDIITMNNEKLEVDDLAEKVTQAQLDEIKDHFDTKINGLESKLILTNQKYADTKVEELKAFILEENEKVKVSKNDSFKFWMGSVIVPAVTVIITLIASKFFGA